MEYYVVVQTSVARLEREVNQMLELGWLLFGDLIVDNDPDNYSKEYLQPMIKYKDTATSEVSNEHLTFSSNIIP